MARRERKRETASPITTPTKTASVNPTAARRKVVAIAFQVSASPRSDQKRESTVAWAGSIGRTPTARHDELPCEQRERNGRDLRPRDSPCAHRERSRRTCRLLERVEPRVGREPSVVQWPLSSAVAMAGHLPTQLLGHLRGERRDAAVLDAAGTREIDGEVCSEATGRLASSTMRSPRRAASCTLWVTKPR